MDRAALRLNPGVEPYSCSRCPTQEHLNVRTGYALSRRSLCEADVDGWLRGSKVAGVKVCVVGPPPITSLRAQNKMSAV